MAYIKYLNGIINIIIKLINKKQTEVFNDYGR